MSPNNCLASRRPGTAIARKPSLTGPSLPLRSPDFRDIRSLLRGRAKETSRARSTSPSSYIEDVLALCRRVNKDMSEPDLARHILKGINQFVLTALALQNPTTVPDVTTTCQRLDNLQSARIKQDTSVRYFGDEGLRAWIRAIIREELQNRASRVLSLLLSTLLQRTCERLLKRSSHLQPDGRCLISPLLRPSRHIRKSLGGHPYPGIYHEPAASRLCGGDKPFPVT